MLIELRISTPAGLRKPDIVCINSKTKEATVIDTTISADACVGSLSCSYKNKAKYYNCPAITKWVRKHLDSTTARVNYGALVISLRGAFSSKSAKLLTKSLKLPNRCRPLRGWKTRPEKERRGRPNRHHSIPAPRERGLIQPFFR